jgi:hypothetical protein
MTTDLAPFAGTVGGGFLIGFITGYAIKKVIKLAASGRQEIWAASGHPSISVS